MIIRNWAWAVALTLCIPIVDLTAAPALAGDQTDQIFISNMAGFVETVLGRAGTDPRVLNTIALGDEANAPVTVSITSKGKTRPPRFGVLLDAGIPDGLGASLVYRPIKHVRLHAGATHNSISPGVRAGVTLVPFHFVITPTATVEGGHYFEGDANWIARELSGDPEFENATLKRISYDYANGHVGLEFISQNRFLIYLHAGFSYVRAVAKDFQQSVEDGGSSSGEDIKASDPIIRIMGPSAKAGLIFYF